MIFTIFKKEMLDTLRDRRTLLTMIAIPLLLIPLLMSVTTSFQKKQMDNALAKDLRVAVEHNDNGAVLLKQLQRRKDMKVVEHVDPVEFKELIRNDSLDLALIIADDFDTAIANNQTGNLTIFYNSTGERVIVERLEDVIETYNKQVLKTRLDSLQTTMAMIHPTKSTREDVYTSSESIGKMVGGFLPYIFVIFCLMGAMYPSIDLFTGEKERGTIETILTVPASRLQILLGKMFVVVTSGVLSGLLTIVGLYLALRLNSDIPPELLNVVQVVLTPSVIALIVLMLIPLTTFFSGILIPASIYSKSFKEAQSLIQPMMLFVIIPLAIGMIPSIKLNAITALAPVLNVALACREIIAGTIDYGLLALVFVSLFFFAGIGILICVRWFGQESNILRT